MNRIKIKRLQRQASRRGTGDDRGAVLMIALVLMFALSAGAAVVWKGVHSHLDSSRLARHQEEAYWIAEAGVLHAVAWLNTGEASVGTPQDHALGAGHYRFEVLAGGAPGARRVVATGNADTDAGPARSRVVRLEATVRRGADGRYQVGSLTRMREEP